MNGVLLGKCKLSSAFHQKRAGVAATFTVLGTNVLKYAQTFELPDQSINQRTQINVTDKLMHHLIIYYYLKQRKQLQGKSHFEQTLPAGPLLLL